MAELIASVAKPRLATFLSFSGLALCIASIRFLPVSSVSFTLTTLAVFAFWISRSIEISFSSVRTLLLLALGLGFAVFLFHDFFPTWGTRGEAGQWRGLDLTPGLIESFQASHSTAFELYMDHKPTEDERYVKVGALSETHDGLEYRVSPKEELDPRLLPKTEQRVREQGRCATLEPCILEIRSWWQNGFRYSSSPGQMTSEHPLDQFLFEKKIGFCEHYAAALATLLRLEGFKTRVVVGFSGGTWNPLARTLTFEMSDSHAWIEVFQTERDRWTRVDPTEWVSPEKSIESSKQIIDMLFTLLLGFLFAFAFYFWSMDSVGFLFGQLTRLEYKFGYTALGFTAKERMLRIGKHFPDDIDLIDSLILRYQKYAFPITPKRKQSEGMMFRIQVALLFILLHRKASIKSPK